MRFKEEDLRNIGLSNFSLPGYQKTVFLGTVILEKDEEMEEWERLHKK